MTTSQYVGAKAGLLLEANRRGKKPSVAFGGLVKGLRKSRDMSGTEFARLAGIKQPRLSKIEHAAVVPTAGELAQLIAFPGLSEAERTEIAHLAQTELKEYPTQFKMLNLADLDAVQNQWYKIEQESFSVRVFQHSLVPGLLQIPPYAEAALAFNNFSKRSDLAEALKARTARAAQLQDPRKEFRFVITDAALRISLDLDPASLKRQLRRIQTFVQTENVSIRILTLDAMRGIPLDNFHILDDELVTIETLATEVLIDHPHYVDIYASRFEEAWEGATNGNAAKALIETEIERIGARFEQG